MEISKKLFKFLNLPWVDYLTRYINTHTKRERKVSVKSFKKAQNDPYGTVRDSRAAVLNWTKSLSIKNISAIQEACKSPMRILGYKPIENSADLVNFKNSLNNLPEINKTWM